MKIRIAANLVLIAVSLAGCTSVGTQKSITANPSPCVLTPDRYGNASMDVELKIPSGFMSKRMCLTVTPRLMTGDEVLKTYPPIVREGSVYHKKQIRQEVFGSYTASDTDDGEIINVSEQNIIQIHQKIILPMGINTARVVGLITTDGCGKCETYGELDLALLSSPLTLLPELNLQTIWDDTQKTVAPKIFNGREEARLQFEINKSDINPELGSNRSELQRVLSKLRPVVRDRYSTLNALRITGMASADGPLKFNTELSRDRAMAASEWLKSSINFPAKSERKIKVTSMPEGWGPVLEAMKDDNHPDAPKVERIIEKYSDKDDDVAEKYIRELKSWNEIAAKYLAKDRKVEFEYTYTVKNFTTDDELKKIYSSRPDLFSEAEFMKVASMYADRPDSLQKIYETALKFYPQSEVMANNLAVLKIGEGKFAEAKELLKGFGTSNPTLQNNLAVAEASMGENERAENILKSLGSDISRHNLGLLYAADHDVDRAWSLLENEKNLNAAIVALAVNENLKAGGIMDSLDDDSPLAEFVRAMVSSRLGDEESVFKHLKVVAGDSVLKNRAQSEPDFYRFHEDSRFRDIFGL